MASALRAGRHIVLIGHAGHAEVEGTIGQIPAPVHIVSRPEDVARLPIGRHDRVAYITQTTLSVDDTRAVIATLHDHFPDLVGPDVSDICYATQNPPERRARAGRAMRWRGGGGRGQFVKLHPAGGNRAWLRRARLAGGRCRRAGHGRFGRNFALGITAGASAPDVLVQGVIERLAQHRELAVSELDGETENVSFNPPCACAAPGVHRLTPPFQARLG
jgi:4-hydroxy-3-methylbut-2-enyl diphosphate reductase